MRLATLRRPISLVLGMTAVIAAVAGIAIAQSGGDGTQQRMARPHQASKPTAMPPQAARSFGVLRTSSKPVPPAVDEAFRQAPAYESAMAPNPALARRLPQTNPYTGTEPWLVPGDDALCLYVPDTEGAAMTCNTLAEARAGGLHLVLTPPDKPAFVVGIVPDGVGSVQVTDEDGSSSEVRVAGNAYSIQSADARAVAAGSSRYSIPQLPKLPLSTSG